VSQIESFLSPYHYWTIQRWFSEMLLMIRGRPNVELATNRR